MSILRWFDNHTSIAYIKGENVNVIVQVAVSRGRSQDVSQAVVLVLTTFVKL